jgi:hypothetical protein
MTPHIAPGADIAVWPSTAGVAPTVARNVTTLVLAVGLTTAATEGWSARASRACWVVEDLGTTGSSVAREPAPEAHCGAALGELRRRGGLTWDQTARLFGVTRRAVHFWASGKPMTSDHEEHLHRMLGIVREARAPADVVRSWLLSSVSGVSVLTLLRDHKYAEAAVARPNPPSEVAAGVARAPLSAAAQAARRPVPPEVLGGGAELAHATADRRRVSAVRTRNHDGS